ncbi:hypothetical protein SSX86_001105 [Deinandra increscens subsp. villosa]|uniref:Uncharacterized protein n=1 Tax=Deinandra increscens subsp. villosa TaxID=3103831 RepID=A0AAP0DYE2_9ASTR
MVSTGLYNNNHNGSSQHEILEVFNRQLGFHSPRKFSRRISASEALVNRFGLAGKLIGHKGCVTTIEFNYDGDHLVSGSLDGVVMFWNVGTKSLVFSYDSGHTDSIFHARIMPFTDDRTIVTSAADGQVRLGQVAENGHVQTKRLGEHNGRAHKLAIEPGSPHIFYSCGEDGLVQHFDLRSNSSTKLLYCSSVTRNTNWLSSSNSLELYSIIIDPRNPNYFSLGGSDQYARVYDIRKLQRDPASSYQDRPIDTFCPKHLLTTHDINITGISYSNTSELLVSYNRGSVYLFQKDMSLGPYPVAVSEEHLESLDEPQMYSGHKNSVMPKGVSFFGPDSEYVMSGSDCGHIYIWNKKDGRIIRVTEGDGRPVTQVKPHPNISVLASCSILERHIKLWAPVSEDNLPLRHDLQEVMESDTQARKSHSPVTLRPDVIPHVLRHDIADDEEDESDAYGLGFSDGDGSFEDGYPGDEEDKSDAYDLGFSDGDGSFEDGNPGYA